MTAQSHYLRRVSMPWNERLLLAALARLPRNAISRAMGHLASLPLPVGILRFVIRRFASAVGVDWSEVRDPLTDFRSLSPAQRCISQV